MEQRLTVFQSLINVLRQRASTVLYRLPLNSSTVPVLRNFSLRSSTIHALASRKLLIHTLELRPGWGCIYPRPEGCDMVPLRC